MFMIQQYKDVDEILIIETILVGLTRPTWIFLPCLKCVGSFHFQGNIELSRGFGKGFFFLLVY